MGLQHQALERKTNADVVFAALYNEIVDLSLLPGTKLSEVDVAKRFDLSRQPVREAFRRLSEQGLLAIRPQRPTIVRHFSMTEIQNARFIRAGVELEVLRRLCAGRDTAYDAPLDACIAKQQAAVAANDSEAFHSLDYDFHKLICAAAGVEFAFKVIADSKALVDRLCMLSLTGQAAMEVLCADHADLLDAIRAGDVDTAHAVLRRHMTRLNETIEAVHAKHPEYFE